MGFFGTIERAVGRAGGLLHEHRLAAVAFLLAVAWVPNIFSYASMPRWWVLAVGLPLAADLDPRKLVATPAGALLAAGLAWAAISLAWAPIPRDGVLDWFFLALLAFSTTAAIERPEAVENALAAFSWGLAVSSAIAVAQRLGWNTPWIPGSGVGALFLNSEVLAETAAPIFAWAVFSRRWTSAAIALAPLAVCNSRIAVVAAAVGLWFSWRTDRTLKVCVAILVLLAIPLALLGAGDLKIGSAGTRIVLWAAAVESVVPLGRGLGWWAAAHPNPMETVAHSDALQFVVDLGIGAMPFLLVPVAALFGGGDDAKRAAFVVIVAEAAVSFPLHLPATVFLAGLLAGALAADRRDLRWPRFLRRAENPRDLRRQAAQGLRVDRDCPLGACFVSARPEPETFLELDDRARRAGGA